MENSFKLEIISPENIIYSGDVKLATLPSYEGEMGLLKNHIPIITFLKPGIIKVEKNKGEVSEFFVEDGTVDYFNDVLVILSSSAIDVKKLTKDFLNKINKDAEEKLATENISDHDRYILIIK